MLEVVKCQILNFTVFTEVDQPSCHTEFCSRVSIGVTNQSKHVTHQTFYGNWRRRLNPEERDFNPLWRVPRWISCFKYVQNRRFPGPGRAFKGDTIRPMLSPGHAVKVIDFSEN